MPGIAGIISRKSAALCERKLRAMVASMRHESFYTVGTCAFSEIGVFAGCVARDGSFAARRIFWNEERDVALILSGECYIDAETRSRLQRDGHQFVNTGGDCLVHLYEEQGETFFENLNGQFSGLLVDRRQNKVFLFNDRYRMERIYWHETSEAFYFASEAKAILSVVPELRCFDEQGVAQFLAYGCPLEERTLFKGISLLPGGSVWSFENDTCLKRKYFSPATLEQQSLLSVEAFESELQSTFRRILPRYTESETPLGISLTAGLDSRMIMACLPERAMNSICYTYSGAKTDILDSRLAGCVAAACGLDHKILRLGPDFFTDFSIWADKTIYATDGCFGITGSHEVYFSRQARNLSPARLTGVFGGEIFRGVSTFKPTSLSADFLQRNMTVTHPIHEEQHPVTFAAFKEIPYNMFGTVSACRSQLCFRSPYLDNELVALAYRAPLSLRHSCDSATRFVRNNNKALGNIPTDMGYLGNASELAATISKIVAKVTFKFDYYYSHGLPRALSPLDPMFQPFGAAARLFGSHRYLHYPSWFRRELMPYVRESLAEAQKWQNSFWNIDFVKRMAEVHGSGRKNYVQEINAVLTLTAVERLLFRKPSCESNVLDESLTRDCQTVSIG